MKKSIHVTKISKLTYDTLTKLGYTIIIVGFGEI